MYGIYYFMYFPQESTYILLKSISKSKQIGLVVQPKLLHKLRASRGITNLNFIIFA